MSQVVDHEIAQLERQAQEIELRLQAIGPQHVMYAPLMNELDLIKFNLATIKGEAQNFFKT